MVQRSLILALLLGLFVANTPNSFAQLNKSYFFNQARQQLGKEQFPEAIASLNHIIRVDTTIAEVWFLRGVAKYYLNDLHGALSDFNKTILHNPVYSQAYLYRAVVLSQFAKYNQAFMDYEMAIDLRPNSPDAYYSRGISNIITQQPEKAIRDFTQVIKFEPKNVEAWLNRGIAYLLKGDTVSALHNYGHAISLNIFNAESYGKRGKLYYEMGKYPEALSDFNQAIKLDTTQSINFFLRALTLNALDNIEGSIADLNRAIVLSPSNALSIYNRALIMWQKGDTKAALNDFDRVVELNPDNLLVYFNRGVLLYEMDNYTDAIDDFTSAIELFSDFAKAYLGRSMAYARLGLWNESERDKIFAHSIAERYSSQHNQPLTDTAAHFMNLIAFSADFSQVSLSPSLEGYDSKPIDILPFIRVTLVPKESMKTTVQNFEPLDSLNEQLPDANYQFVLQTQHDTGIPNNEAGTHSKSYPEVLAEGIRLSAEGKFNQAIEMYEKAYRIDPNNPLSLINLSVEKAEMVHFIASFEREVGSVELKQNIRKSGKSAPKSGIQLISFEESLELLNLLDNLMPDHYIVQYNKANIFALSGDMDSAIELYDKAIALNPHLAEAWYNKGLIHLMLKDNEKGCSDLGKAGEMGIRQAYLLIHRFCRK
ncbi:MAG: tetratricopeptide repeat protein [Tenuifilaceae bacterium]